MKIIIIDATVAELKESRILDLIRQKEVITAAPMAEPEKPKPAKKTDKVDWPKAKALRDAGWSYENGDELGISGVTVSAHLKEVEK